MHFRKKAYNLNSFWLFFVLVFFASAIVCGLFPLIPFGSIILFLLLELMGYYFIRNNIAYLPVNYDEKAFKRQTNKNLFLLTLLAAFVVWLLLYLPLDYQVSLMQKVIFLIFFLYVCWCLDRKFSQMGNIKYPKARLVFLSILIFVFTLIVGTYINSISMLFVKNYVTETLDSVQVFPIGSVVTLAIMPAFTEELYFRGYIMNQIKRPYLGIVVSALLFALLHMNFNQISYALFFGLVLGALAWAADNIVYSIIVHFLVNLHTLLVVLFSDSIILNKLYSANVMGYNPFNLTLVNEQGIINTTRIMIGAFVAILSLMFIILLIKIVAGERKKENPDILFERDSMKMWKPDKQFLVGCLICMVATLLFELA